MSDHRRRRLALRDREDLLQLLRDHHELHDLVEGLPVYPEPDEYVMEERWWFRLAVFLAGALMLIGTLLLGIAGAGTGR